jgi:hypothetical protein
MLAIEAQNRQGEIQKLKEQLIKKAKVENE